MLNNAVHETINMLRNMYMSDVGSEDTSPTESSVLANQEPFMYFQGPRVRRNLFFFVIEYQIQIKVTILNLICSKMMPLKLFYRTITFETIQTRFTKN